MLSQCICNSNVLIKEVLVKLNENKRKFVICVDEFDCVVGVVTDGDIRRALLNNISIIDTIDKIYSGSFKYLNVKSSFSEVCKLFRLSKVDFLPIIDENRVLVNVLTKVQFHLALLENIDFDLRYDFFQLDILTLEHEVYSRPWGFYKSTFLTTHAQAKIITVLPNSELSLQKRFKREEHWVILKGEGKVVLDEAIIDVSPGKYINIPKECKHQIINNSDENLIFSEVQLGEYFGEDDIVRYADKYGRNLKGENNEI